MLRSIWKRYSSKQTRLKVLIAACLFSIVPVIVLGVITYMIASNSMMQEIGKTNKETMRQIQERIDKLLVTDDKIVLQQAFNPTLTDFLNVSDPYKDATLFKNVNTILNSMETLIENVDSVYLYMKRQQLVVNPSEGIVKASKLDAELLQRINERKEPYFWLDRKTTAWLPRGGSHVVTLVRRLPVTSNQADGYLIINLNERAFFEVFSSMHQNTSGEMIIITPTGNIFSDWNKTLFNRGFTDLPFVSDLMDSSLPESFGEYKIDGRRMLVNSLKSSYNEWRYVSVIPLSELTTHIQSIKKTTIVICLVLILISLFASILLSQKLFRAISGFVETIRGIGKFNQSSPHKMDEFGLIRYYVESLQSENNQLESEIQQSMPFLRANFIQRLLTEPFRQGEFGEKLAYYKVPNSFSYYTVLCVELDHLRGQSEQDVNLFLYAAINIAKEIISHHTDGMVVRMQSEQITVVINHEPSDYGTSHVQTDIFRISEEIRSVIEKVLNVTATIGVGCSYMGIENVHRSYKEAVEAIKHQLIVGTGTVLFIDRVNPEAAVYSYPVEQEQLILSYLKLGNLDQIESAVDDFAETLKAEEALKIDHVRQSFVQLLAATLRTLYELDPKDGPKLFTDNVYQTLNQFKTIEHIKQWLKTNMFLTAVTHIRLLRSERNSQITEKVLDYIHEHYDKDLSQAQLADMVMMPVSHFSSLFKQGVGVTFTEYIIGYRIEKAKELLTQSDMKVSDIANRLRYNNSQNFIRTFKRVTGITPGDYRNKQLRAE